MGKQETNAIDLLYLAKKDGIDVILNEEQLQLKVPKNRIIDKNLIEDIKNNKKLIIDFLKQQKNSTTSHNEITKFDREKNKHLPLSFSQERLWFIDQLEGSVPYHMFTVWSLKGSLNKEALKYALQTIVNRHEVLRTVILVQEGEPYQSIKDKDGWQVDMIDGALYNENREGLQQYIQRLIKKPFDVSKDYMIRSSLITLSDKENVLVTVMHHISSDGWSNSVYVREMTELYNAYVEQRTPRLPALPIQYVDYALWQRNYLKGEVLKKKIEYWKNKLKNVAPLQLPTDFTRPAIRSAKGALKRFKVDKALSEQLKILGNQQGTTLFMILLTGIKVLFHRYSGQEDICIGSPIANRTQHEVEGLIGFFVNTLALRNQVRSDSSFIELLQQVKATTMEAYDHQDVPFEKIVEAVVKERDLSRNPLFQVMLAMQNTPRVNVMRLGDVQLWAEDFTKDAAQFDINFSITEKFDGLQCTVEYATDLYNETTIIRMMDHFKTLLSSIVKDPYKKIGELGMLTGKEVHQLLVEFNDTKVNYPTDKTIVDLFEEQAASTPQSIAAVFEEQHLNYKQLNEKANQLAHYLRNRDVKEETLVPICIERGLEMIVGILGILKSGGAYVPIDPEYPQERINYMLEDTGALIVISSNKCKVKLQGIKNLNIIELDSDWVAINNEPLMDLPFRFKATNLAYVIYTSGSTGKPKGVMIEQISLVNLLKSVVKNIVFKSTSSILSVTTISFDISYLELFAPLISGGKLILVSKEVTMDGFKLVDSISNFCPTHMQGTPATWQLLLDAGWKNREGLEMLVGGESVKESLKNQLTQMGIVYNLYGPTETTIWSTIKILKLESKVSIGKPIANTTVYIVNDLLQLCPLNVIGEICIAKQGLARGYLHLPELTEEKFIPNPFVSNNEEKMYRTGDLGRWLANGDIEYLGRKDDQVKIRGYRIELGEIESALQQCEWVHQGVVVAREDRSENKQLIGYVVPKNLFNKDAVINELKKKLPEYMIPTLWVEMKSLPLTPNGKIDKNSLPDFDASELLKDNYVAPRNETEEMIAKIWEEVLEIEKVGMNNNFFELGGHSLVILKLASKIRELGLKIEVKDFFKYQTIAEQSNFIKTSLKLLHTASEGKFVIPIQPGGNNIPLFGIPEFLLYAELGKFISPDQPLYSIEHSHFETLEEIADHYVVEIKKTLPHGPYALMGYCDWGNTILQITETLIQQGEEVPVLVLTEYYAPSIKMSRISLKYIKQKVTLIKRKIKEKKLLQEKLKFIFSQVDEGLIYFKEKFKRPRKKTNVSVYTKHYHYTGKVILFQSSQTIGFKDDPLMGWDEVFTGEVKKYIIEGDHLSMMGSPVAAAQMAKILNANLKDVKIIIHD